MSDETEATARTMAELDQAQAAVRALAETCVTIRKTLIEGGFVPETADAMVARWWGQFCGPSLGMLLGGGA